MKDKMIKRKEEGKKNKAKDEKRDKNKRRAKKE